MKIIYSIGLIAFISIAVFGFIAMDHGSTFSDCVKAVLPQSMNCENPHSFSMGVSHADAYHAFSNTIISAMVLALLMISFLLASLSKIETVLIPLRALNAEFNPHPVPAKISDWFIKLQKRDPLSA